MQDHLGRTIDYLRISLTDRCNLRCVYCMPEEGVPALFHEDIVSLEEVETLVRAAAKLGIKHLRLTGGEPLVRRGIVGLIERLKGINGIESIALTTNGILLPRMAHDLKQAGLDRVNISLDTLDAQQYRQITRRGALSDALAGIDAALEHDFSPVKINVVAVRHFNQDFARFAQLTLDRPLHVRFIEYMPVGLTAADHEGQWTKQDVVPADEIRARIDQGCAKERLGTLHALDGQTSAQTPTGWGPATYYALDHAQGTVGFISAVSHHFCASCNRLRLTADGRLRPCLFSDKEFDLRSILRAEGLGEEQRQERLIQVLREALAIKPENHHHREGTQRTMSQMGG